MTPQRWDGCVKIHEGCGGVCRWVEAIDRPAVGYTGECVACGETNIPVEAMIPLEGYDHRQLLRVAPNPTLAGLGWDADADWDGNQARLQAIVDDVVRRHGRLEGGASS